MKKIPLNHLNALLVFSESKNMIEAAQRLQITQPALSQQLKLLENLLPHSLFAMQGKKKVLTSYGNEVCTLIKKQVTPLQDTLHSINNQFSNPELRLIKIAGRLEILKRLNDHFTFPGKIHFLTSDSEKALQDLMNRKIDIAISTIKPDSLLIHSQILLKDKFILIYPKCWKLTNHGHFNKEFEFVLSEKPFIEYHPRITKKINLDFLNNLVPYRSIEDWEKIVHWVEKSKGWSIIPNSFSFQKNLCESIPLSKADLSENCLYLLYNKENLGQNWFKTLIQEIKENFAGQT